MIKLFVFLIAGFYLTSCTSHLAEKFSEKSAEDIELDKIKDACDCVDAKIIVEKDIKNSSVNKEDNELEQDEIFMNKIAIRGKLRQKCAEFRKEEKDCSDYAELDRMRSL